MMRFILTKKPQALLVPSISVIGYWVLMDTSWLLILEINHNARLCYWASRIQTPYVYRIQSIVATEPTAAQPTSNFSGHIRSIQLAAGLSETDFVVCGV